MMFANEERERNRCVLYERRGRDRMRNRDELRRLQMDANTPKERLMNIAMEIEEAGFIRRGQELLTIVQRLEVWQHKE